MACLEIVTCILSFIYCLFLFEPKEFKFVFVFGGSTQQCSLMVKWLCLMYAKIMKF